MYTVKTFLQPPEAGPVLNTQGQRKVEKPGDLPRVTECIKAERGNRNWLEASWPFSG